MIGEHAYHAVWLDADGRCPGARRHFRGAARECFGYLEVLAEKDAFIFATVSKIAAKTRRWKDGPLHWSYTTRQIERIMRDFILLEILSPRHRRKVRANQVWGWEMRPHDAWCEACGGLCQFRYLDRLRRSKPRSNVGDDVVVFSRNVGPNVGANVGDGSDISDDKWQKIRALRFTGRLLAFEPMNLRGEPSGAHHASRVSAS